MEDPVLKKRSKKEILMPEPERRLLANDASPAAIEKAFETQPEKERESSAKTVSKFSTESGVIPSPAIFDLALLKGIAC